MAMRTNKLFRILSVLALIVFVEVEAVAATVADDEKDCADQLANLAGCIPFVSGTAKKPTPECCENTQKVKASQPKCMCVLIKESTDPSMGLPINTTLALQMPSACKIDATVANCPALLKIPADSPDAKIFKKADASSATKDSNNPPSSSATYYYYNTMIIFIIILRYYRFKLELQGTPASNNVAKLGGNAFLMIGFALLTLVLV